MISATMHEQILSALRNLAATRGVRILLAVESGSRAWGFASEDSDYDVRFIYAHPADWYVSVEAHRDVIEATFDGDIDAAGWDVRKALGLLRKSNPPLLEWLRSPITYAEDDAFTGTFRRLAEIYYSPDRCFRHYLHMAEGNSRRYLQGDLIALKKYLYVLRPVCACRWIERSLGPVPMEFQHLLRNTIDDPSLQSAIDDLIERKCRGEELDRAPRILAISQFIEEELPRLAAIAPPQTELPPPDDLDDFLRRTIRQ